MRRSKYTEYGTFTGMGSTNYFSVNWGRNYPSVEVVDEIYQLWILIVFFGIMFETFGGSELEVLEWRILLPDEASVLGLPCRNGAVVARGRSIKDLSTTRAPLPTTGGTENAKA